MESSLVCLTVIAMLICAAQGDKEAPPALRLYCNATQACQPCPPGPKHTHSSCRETGFRRELACVVGAAAGHDAPYAIDQAIRAKEAENRITGEVVSSTVACSPEQRWGVFKFELAVAAVGLAATAVLRWRQQRSRYL